MRVLRVSLFKEGKMTHMFTFREKDLKTPIEMVANTMRYFATGMDVDIEIFDGPEDIAEATLAAAMRAGQRIPAEKRHLATLRDFLISCLYATVPDGHIITPSPAPIKASEIKDVVLEVMNHSKYKNQTITVPSSDNMIVQGKSGMVLIKEKGDDSAA